MLPKIQSGLKKKIETLRPLRVQVGRICSDLFYLRTLKKVVETSRNQVGCSENELYIGRGCYVNKIIR